MTAAAPRVSVGVPVYNGERYLAATLDSLLNQTYPDFELVVCDNASTDRTEEIALAGGARVLKTPKRGLGRAYIDAIPFVRGRYIIMGDADCTYDFRVIKPLRISGSDL